MKANIVERAMTLYDEDSYAKPDAIQNPEWDSGRIDFQPWPFPSATKLIVNELKNTLVGGDSKFLADLDPDFVANDLVDYKFVKAAMEKHPGWKDVPGFNAESPFEREEVIKL
jgi:NitT/TauT family transport system substrate-binding protein